MNWRNRKMNEPRSPTHKLINDGDYVDIYIFTQLMNPKLT